MAQRFKGKVAVVTGGGSGIGLAIVRRLHWEGARVVATDIVPGTAERMLEAFTDGRVVGLVADVSTEEGCEAYVSTAVATFGGVHLFVNNAGVMERQQRPLAETSVEEFDRVFATNARGVFLGLKTVMRQMIAQGGGGAIVNTASTAALKARAEAGVYGGSKRAVIGLSNSAALEGGRHGIRVNAICPGPIDTPMTSRMGEFPESLARALSTQALGRRGTADEIANFVAYLLSDEASFQTGGVYTIDGGAIV